MAESKLVQLNLENSSYVAIMCPVSYSSIQYAKAWPHSDITSCCCRSLHAFTSRLDSTLFGCAFFTLKVFLHEILKHKCDWI